MRFKPLLIITLFASACATLPIPGFTGGGHAQRTETHTSSQTEEVRVNGKRVAARDFEDEEEEDVAPRRKRSRRDMEGDIGKTCHKNSECAAAACFVGHGDLGYCTKMCNSFSDCPTFWECKRPGNAPQKICMQDAD